MSIERTLILDEVGLAPHNVGWRRWRRSVKRRKMSMVGEDSGRCISIDFTLELAYWRNNQRLLATLERNRVQP